MKKLRKTFVFRLAVSLLIGLVLGVVVSEGAYLMMGEHNTGVPRQVDLVIPAGTAAKLASGQLVQDLPSSLSFTEGDTLVVKNEDAVAHQLGPIWVPPGASGRLELQTASEYSYTCSFEPGNTLGLNVQPALTPWLRVQGYLNIALPTAIILAVYSLALETKKEPV